MQTIVFIEQTILDVRHGAFCKFLRRSGSWPPYCLGGSNADGISGQIGIRLKIDLVIAIPRIAACVIAGSIFSTEVYDYLPVHSSIRCRAFVTQRGLALMMRVSKFMSASNATIR